MNAVTYLVRITPIEQPGDDIDAWERFREDVEELQVAAEALRTDILDCLGADDFEVEVVLTSEET